MTELIWEGKYDEHGRKVAPPRIALPFQTVETVNESAADRERMQDLFAVGRPTEWRNRLIWGDKKYVLASLLDEFAGQVNLVYIDPPFATGGDFTFTAAIPTDGDDEHQLAFEKQPSVIEQKAYRGHLQQRRSLRHHRPVRPGVAGSRGRGTAASVPHRPSAQRDTAVPFSKPTFASRKTVYNLVACGNDFEGRFARFLDVAPDVVAFAKLPSQFGFAIEYTDTSASLRFYEPDFVAVLADGGMRIVETKGREDTDVTHKDRAATLWCRNASTLTGQDWRYLKVPQHGFEKLQPTSFADLAPFSANAK